MGRNYEVHERTTDGRDWTDKGGRNAGDNETHAGINELSLHRNVRITSPAASVERNLDRICDGGVFAAP